MFFIKLKHFLAAGILSSISLNSVANITGNDAIVLDFPHPQVMSVSTVTNTDDFDVQGEVTRTSFWEIKSNNGVVVGFSGSSPYDNDENENPNIPRFFKQEVNARGELITDEYDYLQTRFGAEISNHDSTEKGNSNLWGGGNTPNSTPTVLTESGLDSPYGYWGTIMPNDAGDFSLSLYSKGSVVGSVQSGTYAMEVVLNISTNEQLNP